MKKITFFLFGVFLLVNIISCQKDSSKPSDLSLTVSQDRVIGHLGDTLPISIIASTSTDKITSITMTKTGGKTVSIPLVSNPSSYSQGISYIVSDSVGTLVFTITAKGENLVDPIIKKLTFTIVKDVEITMGASASSLPSFINGNTLLTYNATEAAANQSLVDLVYKYSATDGAIVGAPNDTIFPLPSWTIKNATKIGKIMDESPDAVSMVTGSSVKNLAVGDMLGYITINGVKGIIEVMDIKTGTSGSATLTFMVIK